MNKINSENTDNEAPESGHCSRGFLRRFMLKRRAWWKRQRLNRLVAKLDLQASQKDGLEAIFTEIESLKASAFSSKRGVAAGLAAAMQGASFNKAIATDVLQQPINDIQSKIDATLQRFGLWFNELSEVQQQQLRDMLQRRLSH